MHRPVSFALALVILSLATGTSLAAPRDELLRLVPSNAAIVILVQDARDHHRDIAESPFVKWFPSTAIGKKVLESAELKQLCESGAMIFSELGITRSELIDDVLGDAAAFIYSPAPNGQPNDERALILIRPRKMEVITRLLEKVNDLQTRSGELRGITRKEYGGNTYFERQKSGNRVEFYCSRGDVFAFSSNEAEIKDFIDRRKNLQEIPGKPPELVDRMTKLGVANSAGVVLINPRALDAEVKAKVAAARPDEKRYLTKFEETWQALDSVALYLTLDKDIELGVSVRFQPGKLPADAKKWLTGWRNVATSSALIPNGALFGVSGHFRAIDLIDIVASLAPIDPGKPGVKEWIAQSFGPIVGRDNLPLVLESLGPNWAIWAEPPAKDAVLPTFVAAVEISGEGEKRVKAEKAMLEAIEFGFQTARVGYNAKHIDQIEVRVEKDPKGGASITTLANDKGFPPGFRPSFAMTKGYLVIATSPEAIKQFEAPTPDQAPGTGSVPIARLSGTQTREYLLAHGADLAKFLASLGVGQEKTLREQLEGLASVLELIDTATLFARGEDNVVRIGVTIKPSKPLKK